MALTMALRQQSRHQRLLLDAAGSATAVFENRKDIGRMMEHVSERMADTLASLDSFLPRCEHELTYARDHRIRVVALHDEAAYPSRLRQCEDAPLVLYVLGEVDLNAPRIVSIVGTRRCSERGRDLCTQLARSIAEKCPGTLIVSGLAYGIDVAAHRAALTHGLPTAGVLAHGLDEIYPRAHRPIAIEMLRSGGLVTEFMSHTQIDKVNFLQRNRIVAGLADAVVVVESPARGGSLNTARLAGDYQREVFTFPGRPSDVLSEGCNLLIRRNGATLITCPEQLLTDLGWERRSNQPEPPQSTPAADAGQGTLFPTLSAEEQTAVDALRAADGDMAMTDLAHALGVPAYKITPLMLALEMKGVVKILPGSRYHLFGG